MLRRRGLRNMAEEQKKLIGGVPVDVIREVLSTLAMDNVSDEDLPYIRIKDNSSGRELSITEFVEMMKSGTGKPMPIKDISRDRQQAVSNDFSYSKVVRQTVKAFPNLITFAYLENDFLREQRVRGNSPETIKYYQRCFKKIYVFCALNYSNLANLDELSVSELAAEGCKIPIEVLEADGFVSDFHDWLMTEEGVNQNTVNSYFRGLKAVSRYAEEQELIKAPKIVIKEAEEAIKETYTEEELKKLLVKPDMDDYQDYRNWVIINYLMGTGNRVSSIAALNVGDVDLFNENVVIRHMKARNPIIIPITAKLTKVLKEFIYNYRVDENGELLKNEPLFCSASEQRMSPDAIKQAIATYNKRRGVSKTSIHLFRHTFAKNWIISGGDIITLARVLGHKTLKMVQHYSNLYGTDLRQQVEEKSLLSTTFKRNNKRTIVRRNFKG